MIRHRVVFLWLLFFEEAADMQNRIGRLLLLLAILHGHVGRVLGAEPASVEGQAAAERLAVMVMLAKACRFSRDAAAPAYTLEPKPLLRWSNPVSGIEDGALWLWTDAGLPVATVDTFSTSKGKTYSHQCQSLADHAFVCQIDEKVQWSPQQAGVVYKLVPDAPQPASTPSARLIQMRAIAREFTVEDDFKTRFRGTEFNTHELRLLTQPLYRYGREGQRVVDGALFAYVLGTACEAILLLEARDQDGQLIWHYGFAGQTCYELRAKHKDQTVWQQPCWDDAFDLNKPFFAFTMPAPQNAK